MNGAGAGEEPLLSSAARRYLTVLFLAIAGGGVDAIILIGFGVLTAAQTGNMILLAVALAEGRFVNGGLSAASIGGFMFGAAAAEFIMVARRGAGSWMAPVGWALMAELAALGCLLTAWHLTERNPHTGTTAVLILLAGMAMGIQSAAVLRVHTGPKTTYVTDTLTTFTAEVVRWLHLVAAGAVHPLRRDSRDANVLVRKRPWIYGMIWLAYAGAALVSGLLFFWVGATALVLPILAIVAATLVIRC